MTLRAILAGRIHFDFKCAECGVDIEETFWACALWHPEGPCQYSGQKLQLEAYPTLQVMVNARTELEAAALSTDKKPAQTDGRHPEHCYCDQCRFDVLGGR